MANTGHRNAKQFANEIANLINTSNDAEVEREWEEASFTVTDDPFVTTVHVTDEGDNFHVEVSRKVFLYDEERHEDGVTVRTIDDAMAAAVISSFL